MKYRNTGAPIPTNIVNGVQQFIDTGVVFQPTPEQLKQLAYKLEPVADEQPAGEADVAVTRETADDYVKGLQRKADRRGR